MRGLACILMFQTHCYDAWLGGAARNTRFLKGSQILGTLPAPIFLFLAGVSFALVTNKLIRKNVSPGEITRIMLRRGAEIFAFGLLFRLQEFLIAWGWAPWSDLLRVDVLNIIGLSMILMALFCGAVLKLGANRNDSARRLGTGPAYQEAPLDQGVAVGDSYQGMPSGIPTRATSNSGFSRWGYLVAASVGIVILFALLTPPLYTNWRPTWLPWPIESYIDGCHNLGSPQPWLFPLFPWAASGPECENTNSLRNYRGCSNHRRLWTRSIFIPALLNLRLLAHKPKLFNDASWPVVSNCVRELCLVPMGIGDSWIQSANTTGANVSARLLGSHRIRLRTLFSAPEARGIDFGRNSRIAGNLLFYADSVADPHED